MSNCKIITKTSQKIHKVSRHKQRNVSQKNNNKVPASDSNFIRNMQRNCNPLNKHFQAVSDVDIKSLSHAMWDANYLCLHVKYLFIRFKAIYSLYAKLMQISHIAKCVYHENKQLKYSPTNSTKKFPINENL